MPRHTIPCHSAVNDANSHNKTCILLWAMRLGQTRGVPSCYFDGIDGSRYEGTAVILMSSCKDEDSVGALSLQATKLTQFPSLVRKITAFKFVPLHRHLIIIISSTSTSFLLPLGYRKKHTKLQLIVYTAQPPCASTHPILRFRVDAKADPFPSCMCCTLEAAVHKYSVLPCVELAVP